MQYWDSGVPPPALSRIMDSWRASACASYDLIDRRKAIAFLEETLGPDWARALGMTRHQAEQSDHFRLCYLLVKGGIHADFDDKLLTSFDNIISPHSSLTVIREPFGAISNNLVMAAARHPIIACAALSAKRAILARDSVTARPDQVVDPAG